MQVNRTGIARRGLLVTMAAGATLLGVPGRALAQPAESVQLAIVELGIGHDPGPGTVFGSGAIQGVGKEDNNQGAPGKSFHATLSFPQGELMEAVAYSGPPKVQLDPTTCIVSILESQTFRITRGTKAFALASGSGTSAVTLTVVEPRSHNGTCEQTPAPPRMALVVIHETGSITMGSPPS
jgi:hypothetical protein